MKQETIFLLLASLKHFSTQIQINDIHWHTKIQFEFGIHCVCVCVLSICYLIHLFAMLKCFCRSTWGVLKSFFSLYKANFFVEKFAYNSLQFIFHCVLVFFWYVRVPELLNSKTMSTMSTGFIYSFAVNHCLSNSNVIVCDTTFYFVERVKKTYQ